MWPFNKPCDHLRGQSSFKDLHRGADGEIYVRSVFRCRLCGFAIGNAVRLPDIVADAIDAQIEIGRMQKKTNAQVTGLSVSEGPVD